MLFQPAGATRSVSRGVSIDYFLKSAADKVTLDILDAQGSVIRTFTGSSGNPRPQPLPVRTAVMTTRVRRRRARH